MGDIKLFRTSGELTEEIEGQSISIEKSLQSLIEKQLDVFLGSTFLASEYSTGKTHGGRIDTLAIDENGCPVIIEYKRATNENVINQGLFYLDWLLDHKAEFELLTLRTLGEKSAASIEWSAPRLVCIAGDFTKYDVHAVQQINRNIELMRYRSFGEDLLLLELINSVTAHETKPQAPSSRAPDKSTDEQLADSPPEIRDLYEALKEHLLGFGDDVGVKKLKRYVAFRRIKNFACVEVHARSRVVRAYVKVSPDSIQLEDGFTRDVRSIGHWGTGDLEITLTDGNDLERAKPLLERSYDVS